MHYAVVELVKPQIKLVRRPAREEDVSSDLLLNGCSIR